MDSPTASNIRRSWCLRVFVVPSFAAALSASLYAEGPAAVGLVSHGELGTNATGYVTELVVQPIAVFRDGAWLGAEDRAELGREPDEDDAFWSAVFQSPYREIRTGLPVFEISNSSPRLGWAESSFAGVCGRFLPPGSVPSDDQRRGRAAPEGYGFLVVNGSEPHIAPPPSGTPPPGLFLPMAAEGCANEMVTALPRVAHVRARAKGLRGGGLDSADVPHIDELVVVSAPRITLVHPIALGPERGAYWIEAEADYEDTWKNRPKDGDTYVFEWRTQYFAVIERVDGTPKVRWSATRSYPGDYDIENPPSYAFLGVADLNPSTPYEVVLEGLGHESWQYIVLDWTGDDLTVVAESGWESP